MYPTPGGFIVCGSGQRPPSQQRYPSTAPTIRPQAWVFEEPMVAMPVNSVVTATVAWGQPSKTSKQLTAPGGTAVNVPKVTSEQEAFEIATQLMKQKRREGELRGKTMTEEEASRKAWEVFEELRRGELSLDMHVTHKGVTYNYKGPPPIDDVSSPAPQPGVDGQVNAVLVDQIHSLQNEIASLKEQIGGAEGEELRMARDELRMAMDMLLKFSEQNTMLQMQLAEAQAAKEDEKMRRKEMRHSATLEELLTTQGRDKQLPIIHPQTTEPPPQRVLPYEELSQHLTPPAYHISQQQYPPPVQYPSQPPQQFPSHPQQYPSQPSPAPQQYPSQPVPRQYSSQPSPSPQQYSSQPVPQYHQPSPSPQQYPSQPVPQHHQPSPSPQQYPSQPVPQHHQPSPSPQQYSSQPVPQQHQTPPTHATPQHLSHPTASPSPQATSQPTPQQHPSQPPQQPPPTSSPEFSPSQPSHPPPQQQEEVQKQPEATTSPSRLQKKNTAIAVDNDVVDLDDVGAPPAPPVSPLVPQAPEAEAAKPVPSTPPQPAARLAKPNTAIAVDNDEVDLSILDSSPRTPTAPATPVDPPKAEPSPEKKADDGATAARMAKVNTAIACDNDEVDMSNF